MQPQTVLDYLNYWLSVAGIVAGVVSVILAIVAIALSAMFYNFSARAQTSVDTALAGIKGQTDTLANITDKQLGRLTRLVSDQARRPQAEGDTVATLQRLTDAVASLGTGSLLGDRGATQQQTQGAVLKDHGIPLLPPEVDVRALKEATIIVFYAMYYYTAYANFFAQTSLPPPENYDDKNAFHKIVKQLLDLSASDFQHVAKALDEWASREPGFVTKHRFAVLGGEAKSVKDLVHDSASQFAYSVRARAGATTT